MYEKLHLLKEPPRLKTERLELVPPDENYANDLFEYGSSKDFASSIRVAAQTSAQEAVKFIRLLTKENDALKRMYWILLDRQSGSAIGTLGFIFPYALYHRVAEFGYGLSPDYWGTGMFQEASHMILKFGFHKLNLARVQVFTRVDNHRAIKSIIKLGFAREATLEKFYQFSDQRVDAAVLALLRDKFS